MRALSIGLVFLVGCVAPNTVGSLDAGDSGGALPPDSGPAVDGGGGGGADSGVGDGGGSTDGGGADGGCGPNTCAGCPSGCLTTDTCSPNGSWQCSCSCPQGDGGQPCGGSTICVGAATSVTSCPSSTYSCIEHYCVWSCEAQTYNCNTESDAGTECLNCFTPNVYSCGCAGFGSLARVEQSTCPGVSAGDTWNLLFGGPPGTCAPVTAVAADGGTAATWEWVGEYLVGTFTNEPSPVCFGQQLPTGAVRAVFGCAHCQVQVVFQ